MNYAIALMYAHIESGFLCASVFNLYFPFFIFAVLTEISHPDQRWLLHDVLEDIDAPTLVLWGDNDKVRMLILRYLCYMDINQA